MPAAHHLADYLAMCVLHLLPQRAQNHLNQQLFGTQWKFLLVLALKNMLVYLVFWRLNFWNWENNEIPIQNYVAWFSISLILLLVFNKILGHVVNKVAIVLFILQFAFFGILCLAMLKN